MSFLIYQKQNPEFLNNYLKYKRFIECCSATTIDEAYFDLRTFLRYLYLKLYNEQGLNDFNIDTFKTIEIKNITLDDMEQVKSFHIEKFIYFARLTLNNSPKTSNRKIASIKRFFEYLSINNLISNNPTKNISVARIEKRNPKFLTLNESKLMLSKTINSDNPNKIRNYAITCLFLNCSLRLAELVGINISNMKLDEGSLKIKGKGGKERITYLNEATIEAIQEYIKIRPKLDKSFVDSDALFISNRNKRISRRAVQTIIQDELYNTFNENRPGFHTHTLRHTGATLMYNENDTNIFVIQKILGHKSLKATEIYTHVSDKKLKYIMENCTISSILEREEFKNGK